MFNWLKKMLGTAPAEPVQEPLVLENPIVEEKPAPAKPKTQKSVAKPKKKAQKSVDLDSMSKTQLLAEAKKRGIKSNASMKKADILAAINNS